MKKLALVLALLFVALPLFGCGGTPATQETKKQQEQGGVEQVAEDDPASAGSQDEEVGREITRKNPAMFDEVVSMEGNIDGVPIKAEIVLSNLIRGDQALEMALEENEFNQIADDEEFIYFDVVYRLLEYPHPEDEPIHISSFDFDYYKSDYVQYLSNSPVISYKDLSGAIYEGGEITGSVMKVIPAGDHGYLLFDNHLWFAIPE